jgi:hypothetical protein
MADPKPNTPPDPKLIPVKTLTFHPGVNVQLPGKKVTTNSLTGAREPVPQEFWTIDYAPSLRSFRVAYYEPGKAPDRSPASSTMVAESVVCTWVPA